MAQIQVQLTLQDQMTPALKSVAKYFQIFSADIERSMQRMHRGMEMATHNASRSGSYAAKGTIGDKLAYHKRTETMLDRALYKVDREYDTKLRNLVKANKSIAGQIEKSTNPPWAAQGGFVKLEA